LRDPPLLWQTSPVFGFDEFVLVLYQYVCIAWV